MNKLLSNVVKHIHQILNDNRWIRWKKKYNYTYINEKIKVLHELLKIIYAYICVIIKHD